jgi:hypothetical protein
MLRVHFDTNPCGRAHTVRAFRGKTGVPVRAWGLRRLGSDSGVERRRVDGGSGRRHSPELLGWLCLCLGFHQHLADDAENDGACVVVREASLELSKQPHPYPRGFRLELVPH